VKTINRESSVLNKSEQLALLKQPNPRAPTGLRNLCIISLMLKTGMKAKEIIDLRKSDVNWDDGLIDIRESGGAKGRRIRINDVELNLLKSWLRIRPDKGPFYFTTLKGDRLQDRYLREMIKRYARKAGIAKDVYPHMLRATFAVDFLKENSDLDLLQEVLGHRDQSTTHNYIKLYFLEQSGINKSSKNSESEAFNKTLRSEKYSQDSAVSLPHITIVAEVEGIQRQAAIPAMKCCSCDFILHYQGDCPQCGASFYSILKHWGKTM
jgi:integrase